MLEILTGLISGIVSGTGMGGGTILILILSVFMRNGPTYGTGNKLSIFLLERILIVGLSYIFRSNVLASLRGQPLL